MFVRAAGAGAARSDLGAVLRHPLSEPGVAIQLVAGALVAAGVILGRVGPAASPRAIAGALVLMAASALNGWALAFLRSWRFRPVLGADHQLCTTGPYAFVRHPIYAAIDLVGVGSALWSPNAFVFLGAVLFVLGGDLRARAEEKALIARFGERYVAYARRVRRLVPGIY